MMMLASIPTEATLTKIRVDSVTWTPQRPKPDSTENVNIVLRNIDSNQIKIKWIGIHFDWKSQNQFDFEYLSPPLPVEPNAIYQSSILVSIPPNVTFGTHSFFVKVEYENDSISFSEKSESIYDFSIIKDAGGNPNETPIYMNHIVLGFIAFLAFIIIIGIGYSSYKRKKSREVKKKRKYRSALSSEEVAADVELARTVTSTDRPKPMSSILMKQKMAEEQKKEQQEWKARQESSWNPPKDSSEKWEGTIHQESKTRSIEQPPLLKKTVGLGGTLQPDPRTRPIQMPSAPPPRPMIKPTQPTQMPKGPPPSQVPPISNTTQMPSVPPPRLKSSVPPPPKAQPPMGPAPPQTAIPPPPPPRSPHGQAPVNCPKCNEPVEPGFRLCPKCGTTL